MGSKYLSNNVRRDLRFQMSACMSNGNMKYQIGKSIIAVNLPLNLYLYLYGIRGRLATVANADIGSLKSLHEFLQKMFVPHASEILIKSYGPNCAKFWAFWQKTEFLKPFFFLQSVDAILEDVSVTETIV